MIVNWLLLNDLNLKSISIFISKIIAISSLLYVSIMANIY